MKDIPATFQKREIFNAFMLTFLHVPARADIPENSPFDFAFYTLASDYRTLILCTKASMRAGVKKHVFHNMNS